MSEEEQGKHKPRIISYIALIVGVATFLCGLLIAPFADWIALKSNGDTYVHAALLIPFLSKVLFLPIVGIGLALSIVTLIIEQHERLRQLPWMFVLVGILIYAWHLYLFYCA